VWQNQDFEATTLYREGSVVIKSWKTLFSVPPEVDVYNILLPTARPARGGA
jgi:hypothetical protein